MATPVTEAASALLSPTTKANVKVHLTSHVNLENITNIVKSIGGRYGCLTCGLGGIDLTLSGDPEEVREFAQLPGVQSVSVR